MPTQRSAIGGFIGLVGIAIVVLCLPPVVRWNGERTRGDIQRAFKPFANLSIDELADGHEHSMSFVVPSDPQWNRIQRRLGKTVFLLVVATDPQSRHPQAFSATETIGARATLNGQPLALAVTNQVAFRYSSTADQKSYMFSGQPNDTVELLIHATGTARPSEARVMAFAHWDPIEMWDWTDGAAMGQGIYELFAPFLAAFGLFVVLIGIRVGRPRKPHDVASS
jgi:hypothetical protein